MKHRILINTVASAAILSMVGAFGAIAADKMPDKKPGMSSDTTATGTAHPGASALTVKEGMEVVDAHGKTIGEVSHAEGDQVIISVGGFLGIGEHDVAIARSEFTSVGAGEDAKLRISMSEETLRGLPEYKKSSTPSGQQTPRPLTPTGNETRDGATERPYSEPPK